MGDILASFGTGITGLLIVLVVSIRLAITRATPTEVRFKSAKSILVAAIGFHLLHFTEEAVFGFHQLFPELLGLIAWPLWLFLGFNISWVVIWLMGTFVLSPNRGTMVTFWFLAIASIVNAIAHPILSLLVAGYFPGLVSSPFVGVFGILLLRQLVSVSTNDAISTTASWRSA